MKAIFQPSDKDQSLNQLKEIAEHYKTEVIQHDTGEGHFIFVKSKIKITEKLRNDKLYIFVWSAKEDDISFLKRYWGEPLDLVAEKMTPMDFATEVIDIPNVDKLTKAEIIEVLEINEKDYNQYLKYIKRLVKRPSAPKDVVKAISILQDK